MRGGATSRTHFAHEPGREAEVVRATVVARGRDHDEFVLARRNRSKARTLRRPPGEDEIDFPMREQIPHAFVIANVEHDLDPGLALAETAQDVRHDVLRGRRDGGHPQAPDRLGPGRAHAFLGFRKEREDAPAVLLERPTRGREANAAAAALDEGDADVALQRRERGRHGGLRNDEMLGRFANRTEARDLEKRPQLGERNHNARIMIAQRIGI